MQQVLDFLGQLYRHCDDGDPIELRGFPEGAAEGRTQRVFTVAAEDIKTFLVRTEKRHYGAFFGVATRTAFLPIAEILEQFEKLEVLVQKTGSPREHEAFAVLRRHVETAQRIGSSR